MKKILPIFLIVLGNFLEIVYYYNRFVADGIIWYLAIIQGLALAGLLMGLFLLRSKWFIWVLVVILALYSITNTTIGQRQSLTRKAVVQVEQISNSKIIILKKALIRKTERYDKIDLLITNSITDFESYWDWKNTTGKYEEELKELDLSIGLIENEIMLLQDIKQEDSEIGKLYNFYSELSGIPSKWLQFFLQLLFSFFICLLSPTGIILLNKKKIEMSLINPGLPAIKVITPIPEVKKKLSFNALIREYTESRFGGEENPKALKGRPMVIKELGITNAIFHKITNVAMKRRLIIVNGRSSRPAPFVTKTSFLESMLRKEGPND